MADLLPLPTRKHVRWLERAFAALKRRVPYHLWPVGDATDNRHIDLEAAMDRLAQRHAMGYDIEALFWQLARSGYLLPSAGLSQQQELQRARQLIDGVIHLRPIELHALSVHPRPDGLLIKGRRP